MENELKRYGSVIQADAWSALRSLTAARIAIGHTGGAIPLKEVLALRMAHAHARDAVYAPMDKKVLLDALDDFGLPVILSSSQAKNREEYLLDPGLGRMLDKDSIIEVSGNVQPGGITIILSDGLSAMALNAHVIPLLHELIPILQGLGRAVNSFVLVEQGRVAIGDQVALLTQAEMTIVLLGERPGLTAADSLGAYLTYNARPGLTDESRNCVSNIHPGGLSYAAAASRIAYLADMAFRIGQSGVMLKEDQDRLGESGHSADQPAS
jgi:ethanolamine ammonia-lyase small subunit